MKRVAGRASLFPWVLSEGGVPVAVLGMAGIFFRNDGFPVVVVDRKSNDIRWRRNPSFTVAGARPVGWPQPFRLRLRLRR